MVGFEFAKTLFDIATRGDDFVTTRDDFIDSSTTDSGSCASGKPDEGSHSDNFEGGEIGSTGIDDPFS